MKSAGSPVWMIRSRGQGVNEWSRGQRMSQSTARHERLKTRGTDQRVEVEAGWSSRPGPEDQGREIEQWKPAYRVRCWRPEAWRTWWTEQTMLAVLLKQEILLLSVSFVAASCVPGSRLPKQLIIQDRQERQRYSAVLCCTNSFPICLLPTCKRHFARS